MAAIVLFTIPSAIGGILEDLDSLHLYQEELGHVCRSSNIESGPQANRKSETEKTLDREEDGIVGGSSRDISENPSSFVQTSSFPIDITAFATVNAPLRGVGAAAAALLVAAEAHRNAGLASCNVAAELERLLDELAETSGRRDNR